jgi:hypothetical protein
MKRTEPRGRCREAPFGLLTDPTYLPAGRRRRRSAARARATTRHSTRRPAGVRCGRGRGRRRRRHAIPVRVVAHAALIRVRASGDEPAQQHECTQSGDKRSHFLFILPGRGPNWIDPATLWLPSWSATKLVDDQAAVGASRVPLATRSVIPTHWIRSGSSLIGRAKRIV